MEWRRLFKSSHFNVYQINNSEKHNKEKRIKDIWFSFYFIKIKLKLKIKGTKLNDSFYFN